MLLCVDVGNTQIVVGVYDQSVKAGKDSGGASGGLMGHFRIATRNDYSSDEMALLLSQMLEMRSLSASNGLDGAVVSSTNPAVGATVVEAIRRWFDLDPLVVSGDLDLGVEVRYERPGDVGPDRLADTVAFLDLYEPPGIVVDFGTATTFDAIGSDGAYLGGAIAPGVLVSVDALFSRAAALSRIDMTAPTHAIGNSTVEAIRSGVLLGFAAMVDGMCARFEAEIGPSKVVGTGGLCSLITPSSVRVKTHEPWLTLYGLRLVYEYTR
ncbi:type III pantothenate kinase [Ferrithrix thermotolerans DSM 19514]|uniref:Type III pantothenate kinase n=1 Tax=Ferrithrix thermotolerans DSM 19514 TaxID=1121881 RepID=A0A1M4TI08_9ACTN|nr:type III pantothenate kinase [Ferrithrix thermotolerans]SHE44103.1 type III pantothenate kinase [Ferrithrix thermotolerans DSM 19514]